ncbi:Transducin/WD40 repeat-like superfamily protein [Rhynchospora pubera]|uniref:Transducin/WD40 repeat-like superfamily protein n=1 Tax=Rhynchospora pubera TaxID=906938 RepID=A0AAV8HFB4_9POAL|nr:Transducin/WD40 repeat-like superfamily protein [Rhynchospora pubera]
MVTLTSIPADHTLQCQSDNSLSKSTSFSSKPSLPSLPSLGSHASTSPLPFYHCAATIKGHSSYVSGLAIYDLKTLVSCSPDQSIKLWRTNHNELSNIASAVSKSPIKSVLVSKDQTVFTSHQDGKVRAWRANLKERNHKLLLLAILPTVKDRFFSILCPKKYVQVRRHKRCTWVNHADAVSALALSHDSKLLYSVSWDRTFKVWRTCNFKCVESISRAHEDAVNAIVVSKDGFVYTGSADTNIKTWRRLPGEKNHSLVSMMERHKSAVNALVLSEDGSVLYSGACDRSVVVWEGGGGQMVAVGALRGHKKAILCLAVNKDVVCSGSADKTIRVWKQEPERGYCYACLAVLEGHAGAIKNLAISFWDCFSDAECELRDERNADAYFVYSGGIDCDIKVWKILVHKEG